ncbi:hypothetical protein [Rhizobium sp. NFACC06-2]|uniref:hypothetical protein n=1 Tax=Rhizobium sp. NFACC06-2 TaxID=1566264 RepID=UPI000876DC42|nr:hypothetical protein [Rhizobium sp. NFACC06-2]SCY42577.1 hypothetical protein SAMN03159288_02455 [Rhizobium sp. NFACC06-2]
MVQVKRFFKGHATLTGKREESAFGSGRAAPAEQSHYAPPVLMASKTAVLLDILAATAQHAFRY